MVQQVLRTLRLKGVAGLDTLERALRRPTAELAEDLAKLAEEEKVKETPRGFMLTPAGREALSAQLKTERAQLDPAKISKLYEEFCALNVRFKALMTDWQIRMVDGEEQPNDHKDRAYDDAIIARLEDIHPNMLALLQSVAANAPRPRTLRRPFCRCFSGDHRMVKMP